MDSSIKLVAPENTFKILIDFEMLCHHPSYTAMDSADCFASRLSICSHGMTTMFTEAVLPVVSVLGVCDAHLQHHESILQITSNGMFK